MRYKIRKYNVQHMPVSCSWFVVGAPGTGKSRFIADLAYKRRHVYPVGRVFCESEDSNGYYQQIFNPLYVSEKWDMEQQKDYIARQKMCKVDSNNGSSVNIIDDCSSDTKLYRQPIVQSIFKNGSRHWNDLTIVGLQYLIDVPPGVRKSVSYVALFKETSNEEIEKMYKAFGGMFDSLKHFKEVFNEITKHDHTAMIIDKRTQTTDIEKCVFYYKADLHEDENENPTWKFGCREYIEHAKKRYDKNYRPKL